jgi:tripartite-type tricarboxylate transporter receptor subunit TctC
MVAASIRERNSIGNPAHVADSIIAKIQREVVEALGSAAVREKLAAQLMEPVGNSPATFRARIDGEIARWGPVIKAANIKVN